MKIKELLNIINEICLNDKISTPYLCGGLPRDKYLGKLKSLSDIDLTTGDGDIKKLSNLVYQSLNKKFSIKKETKLDGHSTIYFKNIQIDFSSNFIDPHAFKYLTEVKKIKPSPILLESFSRDFGCNSMLLSLDLQEILDPTETGKSDCDNKVIKTILPPEITFKANPKTKNNNRIIRSIYLASKLGFTINKKIVEYVSNNPQLITLSSPKTLAKKLNISFELDPEKTSYYLDKMNLYNFIPISNMLSDQALELISKGTK